MFNLRLRLSIALITVLVLPVLVQAAPSKRVKIDKALTALLDNPSDRTVQVIIRTKPGRRTWLRDGLKAHGDIVRGDHPSIGAVSAVVHLEDVADLAADDSVESMSIDAPVAAHSELYAPGSYTQALRETLGLTNTKWTGRDVGIAVIDSGIRGSSDFEYRLEARYDFSQGTVTSLGVGDDFGHGSHVAGLIGASGEHTSYEYPGVARDIRLISLKVLGKNGNGFTSDVIAAIEYATAKKAALRISIINLSLGHPIFEPAATDPLVQAVEAAVRAGIVVVVSAGNYGCYAAPLNPLQPNGPKGPCVVGYGGITSPGNAPSAISVGTIDTNETMTRSDDRIMKYSSRGPTWYDAVSKPDLVAPGHDMISSGDNKSTIYRE